VNGEHDVSNVEVMTTQHVADANRLVVGEAAGVEAAAETSRKKNTEWRVELKFVVNHAIAEQVREWSIQHLVPDRHCDSSIGDGYQVSSLYLDTPHFDVYHRTKSIGQRKFRLRRYGVEETIWLETKQKSKGLSRKRRAAVPEPDTALLQLPEPPEWPGDWFHRRIVTRQLRPVASVTYERFARVGSTSEGDVRLTIDRNLRGTTAAGWQVPRGSSDLTALLPEGFIVELKFREVLPRLFKQLLSDMSLNPATFSKYRAAVDACGLLPSRSMPES
jgi:hypothetical protein